MSVVETCEWDGRTWRRYPDSPHRSYRVYFQRHERWKEPPIWLHQEIWKSVNGDIPEGFHVHHIDENPLNNAIENLECIPAAEHYARHREAKRLYGQSEEQLAHLARIRPGGLVALAAWKISPEGKAAMSEFAKRSWNDRPMLVFVCKFCKTEFQSKDTRSIYCSHRCMQRDHPAQTIYPCVCGTCGTEFMAKKRKQRFCNHRCAAFARESAKRARLQSAG